MFIDVYGRFSKNKHLHKRAHLVAILKTFSKSLLLWFFRCFFFLYSLQTTNKHVVNVEQIEINFFYLLCKPLVVWHMLIHYMHAKTSTFFYTKGLQTAIKQSINLFRLLTFTPSCRSLDCLQKPNTYIKWGDNPNPQILESLSNSKFVTIAFSFRLLLSNTCTIIGNFSLSVIVP